jgi:hypothetical protein
MTRAITVLSIALLAATPAFAQSNVTGDWDVIIQSPQGSNNVKVTFTQDGDKVKGLFKSQRGELPFIGTLIGDELKFAYTVEVQGMALDITMTGKVEASTIAGKAKFGDFGEGDWSATRAETAAATTTAPAASTTASPSTTTSPAAVAAAGQWEITIRTPGGEIPASATLTEENGKLSGTLKRDDPTSTQGEVAITGTIEGKVLKLAFTAVTQQGSLPVTMTGDVDGDSIVNGKAEIGGMGTMEWTAKRKQ